MPPVFPSGNPQGVGTAILAQQAALNEAQLPGLAPCRLPAGLVLSGGPGQSGGFRAVKHCLLGVGLLLCHGSCAAD